MVTRFLKIFLFSTVLLSGMFTSRQARATDPLLAGTLSLVPGLGQVANNDVLEGFAWFAAAVGLTFSGNYYGRSIGYNLWMYNMYDAYRDAGPLDASKENLFQNYIAFANPLNILDPIGAGVVGYGVYKATTATSLARTGPNNLPGSILRFSFVGLGEEGLFRGFLFPAFSDVFRSRWAGAATSSVLFSLSHLPNKDPFYHSPEGLGFLFAFGMIFCWQTYNNDYDLRKPIFAHTWYDVIIYYSSWKRFGSTHLPEKFGVKMTVPF